VAAQQRREVVKAAMNLFHKNKRNVKMGTCGCAAMFNGIAGQAWHFDAHASSAQSPQLVLSEWMPLRGGEAVQSDGLCSVLRNPLAFLNQAAQVVLSICIPLCC
jgi:hypothetical protein